MLFPVAECAELNQLRLERDWTWEQLAAEVRRVTGLNISVRTLHFNLRLADANSRMNDRTIYKIRKYLDAIHLPPPPRARAAAAEHDRAEPTPTPKRRRSPRRKPTRRVTTH